MTNLGTRLTALERRAEAATGCRACEGRLIVGIRLHDDHTITLPDWIDSAGRCRGCLAYIKLCDAEALEKLK